MPINDAQIKDLQTICHTAFFPGSQEYADGSAPWSVWADRQPRLVVQPTSLEEMQAVVKYLYNSNLDFCVRNTGTGSASAADVCLSTHGFKGFQWDSKAQTVTLGAGLSWGEVDLMMEERTEGFALVGARCTWVGVTGGALVGGLSWLSHQYGMTSDPQNLVDAQVMLGDGRVVWAAKEEPDLMWALRGGGGNFGVVTALRFRAYPVSTQIWSGVVLIPYTSLAAVSAAVAAMHRQPADPNLAMHIMSQGPGLGQIDQGARPSIAILPVDFRGEAHARSKEGFGWIWDLPGAEELVSTSDMTYRQVNRLADTFRNYQGRNIFWLCAPLLDDIDEGTLVRAWKWYEECYNLHPEFGRGSCVLLEFMQENAFSSSPSPAATAWPHSGRKHVMQLVLGCSPDSRAPETSPPNTDPHAAIRSLAMSQFAKAGPFISNTTAEGKASSTKRQEFHPGFLHEWNDLREVYGEENLQRLKAVKTKFDAGNRFNKAVDFLAA